MQFVGDIKVGIFVGVDKFGNKFYENMDEFFCMFQVFIFGIYIG